MERKGVKLQREKQGLINKEAWFVYILRCADASLYTGISNDVAARVAAHTAGKGAKYTRGRGPVQLIWQERQLSRSDALKREAEIKRMPRASKVTLIAQN